MISRTAFITALGVTVLGIASCRRTIATEERPQALSVGSADERKDAAPALAPLSRRPECARLERMHLPELGNYGSVQNVRIAADGTAVLVTWEALDQPQMGDSSQVGLAAFGRTTPSGGLSFTTVALPARGYAAAVYTSVAPSRIRGALDLFTYGVAGQPSFETYTSGPAPWKGQDVFEGAGPPPIQQTTLPVSVSEPIVVSVEAPLAVLAGVEAPCESYYRCEKKYDEAMRRGLPKSVRTLSFSGGKALSEVLFQGTPKLPVKPFAPALAAHGQRAFVLYRVDDRLEGAWIDERGKKARGFLVAKAADVGAPALAFMADDLYAAWAERAVPNKPYQLRIARIGDSYVEPPIALSTGTESAFAPAITRLGKYLALTWMEGDDRVSGRIRMGLVSVDRLTLENRVDVTPGGGNRRDPELVAQGDRLYLVYSDFTSKPRGTVELERFACR